ncbi:hypothetical protein CR983_01090 [Candidatus Saccharibacteria bacterium]|nr:MAG: hypothetical protein CR983_01090 [Candidatus Saccharibacteria bacterium]
MPRGAIALATVAVSALTFHGCTGSSESKPSTTPPVTVDTGITTLAFKNVDCPDQSNVRLVIDVDTQGNAAIVTRDGDDMSLYTQQRGETHTDVPPHSSTELPHPQSDADQYLLIADNDGSTLTIKCRDKASS